MFCGSCFILKSCITFLCFLSFSFLCFTWVCLSRVPLFWCWNSPCLPWSMLVYCLFEVCCHCQSCSQCLAYAVRPCMCGLKCHHQIEGRRLGLNELIDKAGDVIGVKLDSLESVMDRRMVLKLHGFLGSINHALRQLLV